MDSVKRTLKDLAFISAAGEESMMSLIDRCATAAGSKLLQQTAEQPPADFDTWVARQDSVRFWYDHAHLWPEQITNGTLVMLEDFFESAGGASAAGNGFGIWGGKILQKWFNRNEYHFTQFSLSHLSDLWKGVHALLESFAQTDVALPAALRASAERMKTQADHPMADELLRLDKNTSFKELQRLSHRARRELKQRVRALTAELALNDMWNGMAKAVREHNWVFPVCAPSAEPVLVLQGLYHPLAADAVPNDLHFAEGQNFMLLTGANMSGKTTLMRALGAALMLAKMGMGVPAKAMQCSFFDAVITNMHVEDDLLKGESFFLAEVKSVKQTLERLEAGKSNLVLMDELFKGTNVHDAYECTKAIVDGLLRRRENVYILSTHLHELAKHFENERGIGFYKFATSMGEDGNLQFDYTLQKGISAERIGYKILVQQGVTALLDKP